MERLNIVISPHVYLRIRSLRHHDTPFLPGLKEIYIPNHNSLDLSSALLLASESSLKVIHLDYSATSDRQFFIPFLYLLSVNSPNLTHLTLHGTANMSTSLELVLCFKNLQSLDLRLPGTYLCSQFLQDLGRLDNLIDMTLDTIASSETPTTLPLMKRFDLTPPSTTSTNSTFIQLRKLHILGNPSSMSRVLDDMHVLMNLTTLLIEMTDYSWEDTESSWKSCFTIISTFPAIEDIQITQIDYSPWDDHYVYALSTSFFYPLYKLNNVKSFVINNSTLSGSDEDFSFLACAFPKLKKFVEPCAEYRREGKGKTISMPTPFLPSKSALTRAQDISCVQYL